MILGNICTRHCRFCAIESGTPASLDTQEPRRAAELVKQLNLRHAVVTSVTRDDLPDGGAGIFAETVGEIRSLCRHQTTIEILTPDFNGSEKALDIVLDSHPDVFSHNLETVERLQPLVRPEAGYRRSLNVLRHASASKKAPAIKSGLMVGMGETDAELFQSMEDLIEAGCELLTIGQYLAPSGNHLPVARFVPPELFAEYRQMALELGFKDAASGPMVRSSYMADSLYSGFTGDACQVRTKRHDGALAQPGRRQLRKASC